MAATFESHIWIFIIIVLIAITMVLAYMLQTRHRFKYEGGAAHHLVWKNEKVYGSRELERITRDLARVIHPSGIPDAHEQAGIARVIAKYNRVLPAGKQITPEQVDSIRHLIVTDNNIRLESRIRAIPDLAVYYGENGIEKTVQTYQLPPLGLLRYMMRYNGVRDRSVGDWIRDPASAPERWRNEITWALENDPENPKKYAELNARATKFEQEIGDYLGKLGVEFRTQEDMVIEQTAKYGRARFTPDFVLKEPMRIYVEQNGKTFERLIHWIDAKNYTLAKYPFIVNSVTKQAQKYVEEFGDGAFIFRHGFVEGVFIRGCTFLDWNGRNK